MEHSLNVKWGESWGGDGKKTAFRKKDKGENAGTNSYCQRTVKKQQTNPQLPRLPCFVISETGKNNSRYSCFRVGMTNKEDNECGSALGTREA